MGVATFLQTNNTTQDSNTYKNAIDGAVSVLSRIGDMFAPHESATPAMTIVADAGAMVVGGTVVAQAAQTSGAITAPTGGNSRIDLAVINIYTLVLSIVTGTPGGSPVAPACPTNCLPVAQIALATSQITIINSNITDVRAIGSSGVVASTVGLEMTGEQSGHGTSTPNLSVSLNMGNVTAGDRILLSVNCLAVWTGGSEGTAQLEIVTGGSGTCSPNGSTAWSGAPMQMFPYDAAAASCQFAFSMMFWVLTSGTLTLETYVIVSAGVTSGANNTSAFFLKKQ